jgi:tetratricopeptide (TPR) repeat protein
MVNVEIKFGDELLISRNELSLKEILLKGNDCYYTTEYNEAIECYDGAKKIDPNYVVAWSNKGLVLNELGKYNEALESMTKPWR